MMKLRSDSTLAQLTEDQRTTLYEWIEEHSFDETMVLAAKPVPDGFNLKFHKTTLQRWFQQERKHRNLQEIAARATAIDLSADPFEAQSKELTQLIAAAKSEFAHAIYELAQAATDPENFDRLQRSLHQAEMVQIKRHELKFRERELILKEQELLITRERLAENRRQWQFNAARTAIEYNIALQKIIKNDKLDDENTIWEANDVCFGPVPRRINSDTLEASSPLSPPSVHVPATAPQAPAAPKHAETHSSPLSKRSEDPDASGIAHRSSPCPANAVIVTASPEHVETHYAPTPQNDEYLPPFSSLPSLEDPIPNPAAENTQIHTNGSITPNSPQTGI